MNAPIWQEFLFTTRFYHETWDSVYFLDILELQEDIEHLKNYTQQTHHYCMSLTSKCTMLKTIGTLKTRINKLANRYENIKALSSKRAKRGLFNFIGTATKYLFGTMTAADAENINRDIDEVYNKTKGIATLIKNQTSLLQTSVTQIEKINKKTEQDLNEMQRFTGALTDVTNQLKINNIILNSLFDMEIHVEETNEAIHMIESAISEAKTGILSPKLVTPEDFMKSLSLIQTNIPRKLPYSLTKENYLLYLKISTIDVTLINNKLIYKVHTPIPEERKFSVFRYISLPQHEMFNSYLFDGIQEKPIALAKDGTIYTTVDESKCVNTGELHFCQTTDILKEIHTEISCMGWILSKEGRPCEKKYIKITTDYIYSFANGYQWYISPYNPIQLTISCPAEEDAQETISIATVLTLEDHCRATSGKQTFLAATHYSKSSPVKQQQIKFNFTKFETDILSTNEIPLPHFSNTHLNLQQLKDSAHNLARAQTDFDLFLANRRNHSWWTTGTTILEKLGYTSLAILILGLFWKCGLNNLLRLILLTTPCGKVIYKIKGPATINHATNAPVATKISYHAASTTPLFKTTEDMV